MILSNTEIHKAIDEGDFVIDPEPLPCVGTIDDPDSPYDTSSLSRSTFAWRPPYRSRTNSMRCRSTSGTAAPQPC